MIENILIGAKFHGWDRAKFPGWDGVKTINHRAKFPGYFKVSHRAKFPGFIKITIACGAILTARGVLSE